MSTYAEALRALQSEARVAAGDIQRWIDSGDLLTWSVVYALKPDDIEFVRRYLLRCIEENPPSGDYLHGGYEAAWELAASLKQWPPKTVRAVALDLETLFRRGDDALRNRILCGVLEHAFEDPSVRPHFANWERAEDLREAYRLAVEWGSTHELS
jgi:hypothetical protein